MEPDPTRRVLTRKRKPLSDCTNTFNSHSSPSLPITKRISSKNLHTPSNPTSPILSTPSLNSSSSLHGTGDVEASGCISIKYSRRRKSNQRKDKGKAIATPLSSTPNLRISNSWEKSGRFEGVNVHKAKALTVPLRKKHRSVSSGQDALKDPVLQDFIEEQRAYFKAIDEFKLSEEEVESGDELD
ncbi:PREDICTED: uncharacterized protein LOC109355913 isoform X3 [Lupinus angustifolius]|uniref:uncharacterized protein LOC109355913 isoform X3 n=1 Tax=Lupinus angustifolius TaxID=3871 RepID=UPI00092E35AE|nr:PREDICTED: uncharacterized protein LOC109355913 isoform X3 [Lupinus angustifolius]